MSIYKQQQERKASEQRYVKNWNAADLVKQNPALAERLRQMGLPVPSRHPRSRT